MVIIEKNMGILAWSDDILNFLTIDFQTLNRNPR